MVTITKIYYPPLFDVGSSVGFDLSDGSHYEGTILSSKDYHISIEGHSNNIIFTKLGIADPSKYIKEIVGYYISGAWPFMKTLNDLKKVLYALQYYKPDRIPEDKKVIISDDEKKPFTLNVKKHKQTKLNYKL